MIKFSPLVSCISHPYLTVILFLFATGSKNDNAKHFNVDLLGQDAKADKPISLAYLTLPYLSVAAKLLDLLAEQKLKEVVDEDYRKHHFLLANLASCTVTSIIFFISLLV